MATLVALWSGIPADLQGLIVLVLQILGVTIAVVLSVALMTYAERKVIGWIQVRHGPNQIRIFGLPFLKGVAQPFADVIKLLLKEVLLPAKAVAGVTTRADVMAVAWMTAVTVTAMGRMEDRSLGGL